MNPITIINNYYILDTLDFDKLGIKEDTVKYIINKMLKEEFPFIEIDFIFNPDNLNLPILKEHEVYLFNLESKVRFIIKTLVESLTPDTFIKAKLYNIGKHMILHMEMKNDKI